MHRWPAVCIFTLISCVLTAQESSKPSIQIEVVEGDGAINSIRLHRAHDPVVRVTGPEGESLPGVTVTFLLPSTGASATFPDGAQTLTIQTDKDGRAAGRGLRPNAIEGQFQIRVKASSRGSENQAVLMQTNAEAVIKSGHTTLIVVLAAVAGAAAGGAVLASRGKSSPSDTTSTTGGSINAGAPIFGPPH